MVSDFLKVGLKFLYFKFDDFKNFSDLENSNENKLMQILKKFLFREFSLNMLITNKV